MNFPSIYPIYSVKKIMFLVLIACVPGICTKFYFFGPSILIQILFSVIISILLEVTCLKLRGKNIKNNIYDNSAILTGVLFSVGLPSFLPGWIIIIGLFFAIVVGKQLYGGIGQNIFNPAMIGYAVLLVSFPFYMNQWVEINTFDHLIHDTRYSISMFFSKHGIYNEILSPDFFTQATPLDIFKTNTHVHYDENIKNFLFISNNKNISFSYIWINISFFLGGIFLLYKKIICWRIPFSFLMSLIFISSITWYISEAFFASPVFHIFSGGTMICAFFIATDPVTTACTNIGRIIFGVIIGIIAWLIRNYSDYPDSIAFSVLFANMIAPLIDYYIKLDGYGR